MPQLPVKEVRRSELHLPDITREDVVRSLSEIHLPDLPDAVSKFEWPKVDLPTVDLGKAMSGAAVAAHIRPRPHGSRWPLVGGLIVVASLVGWAVLSNEALRARLAHAARAIRERVSAMRSSWSDRPEVDPDHPIAFPAAETAPIQTAPFTDSTTVDPAAYPAGLGSNNGDEAPAIEETRSPA